jgi:hypothetical protein
VKALAAPEDVWTLVKDVSKWKTWLLGVQDVQLNGPFVNGATGLLILGDGMVHEMLVQRIEQGRLEVFVKLRYGVRLLLTIDVPMLQSWSQIKMEGKFFGAMSILHYGGWVKNLRTGLAPTARLLGELSQGVRR